MYIKSKRSTQITICPKCYYRQMLLITFLSMRCNLTQASARKLQKYATCGAKYVWFFTYLFIYLFTDLNM